MNYSVFNIREMIHNGFEDSVKAYISDFSCQIEHEDGSKASLNPGIEQFLTKNAIQFAKMKTAITYLVIDTESGGIAWIFYFSP